MISSISLLLFNKWVDLRKYQTMPKATGRPSTSIFSTDICISDSIRFDKVDYLIKLTEDKKKKRCAGKDCKSIMRTMCIKCNVGFCADVLFFFTHYKYSLYKYR